MTLSRELIAAALLVCGVAASSCESAATPVGGPSATACARQTPGQPAPPAPPATTTSVDRSTATRADTGSTGSATASATTPRPASWAQPLTKPGLPNLYQVSDDLYRGAQPTAEGMGELVTMKVRTVVNLRSLHSDRRLLGSHPLAYEHITMKAWHTDDDDLVAFLKLVTDATKQPLFVHCKHGADRTGLVVAVYRIAVQGWTKEEAIAEMTTGGFGHHAIWRNLTETIEQLDVDRIKREAGLKSKLK